MRLKQTRDSPQYVISTAASQLSENAAQDLPAISSVKRTIHNVGQKERAGFARHSYCKNKSRKHKYEQFQEILRFK